MTIRALKEQIAWIFKLLIMVNLTLNNLYKYSNIWNFWFNSYLSPGIKCKFPILDVMCCGKIDVKIPNCVAMGTWVCFYGYIFIEFCSFSVSQVWMAGINNVDVDWVDDSNETPLCSKSDFKLCSALHCDQVSNSLHLIQGIRFLLSILVHIQDDV